MKIHDTCGSKATQEIGWLFCLWWVKAFWIYSYPQKYPFWWTEPTFSLSYPPKPPFLWTAAAFWHCIHRTALSRGQIEVVSCT